jgi:hypothetical protein
MSSVKHFISETRALDILDRIRDGFRARVESFETKAKPCSTCDTRGACCLDAHFVNVRISRLEAVAINDAIAGMNKPLRSSVSKRIDQVIEKFGLDESASDKTYACPLYDRDIGCVVHNTAKPLPCINHACYERREDLPPDELLDEAEFAIERLNRQVYGRSEPQMSLPIAIKQASRI